MEQQRTDTMRERLLARVPQPENLGAYREETATLLAKHARALRWDYFVVNTFYFLAGVLLFVSIPTAHWRPDEIMHHSFQFGSALMFFVGMIFDLRYRIYDNQIANLKEIKQVQLQLLEVQARLDRNSLPKS